MIKVKDVVSQLCDIYYNHEFWHKNRMNRIDAIKYHTKLLNGGNIIYYQEKGELLGYASIWRINSEQWERLKGGEHFSAYWENVQDGNIAYVANIWIRENMRFNHVIKMLKLMFYKHNCHCDYFAGEPNIKNQPSKIFRNRKKYSFK